MAYSKMGSNPAWSTMTITQGKSAEGSKLYVGNLTYNTTDGDLEKLFESFGTVNSAIVIMDRDTGKSKGFGFVEMSTAEEAKAAIEALNGTKNDGRALIVSEARPKVQNTAPRSGQSYSKDYSKGYSKDGYTRNSKKWN